MKNHLSPTCVIFLSFLVSVSGCGGSKVLKEPEPLVVSQPLAVASDGGLSVTLDWVIVRGGPGSWAKNADWDQYLLRAKNVSDDPLEITNIVVLDSLGTLIHAGDSRGDLVKGAKKAKRRYKDQGLKVMAGAGAGTMMVAGAGAFVGSAGLALSGGVLGATSTGAAVAATGLILAAPVLAVGGVFRVVNNSKVNNQVESRQTVLPLTLHEDEEKPLDVFFPLTPSPRQIELTYVDSQGEHTLIVDTHSSLEGLHLTQDPE
jgi:hypothetical protein